MRHIAIAAACTAAEARRYLDRGQVDGKDPDLPFRLERALRIMFPAWADRWGIAPRKRPVIAWSPSPPPQPRRDTRPTAQGAFAFDLAS